MFNGRFTAEEFARKARDAGYRWVSFEWNDFGNEARGPAVKAACDTYGLVFTIWLKRPFTAAEALQAVVESQCEGFIAEAEIPAHRPEAQNWPELIHALSDVDIPKAVATNFAAFVHEDGKPWPEKARPLIEDGWSCMTECYDLGGDPAQWPERRAFFATHLGWNDTQPILGAYGGRTIESFPTRDNYRNWSVWDAGSVLP